MRSRRHASAVGRRLAILGLLVGVALVVLATPAWAHASLLSSTPSPGQVLNSTPKQVTLQFTEPVEVSSGAVRVFNTDEERVDDGGASASGNTVRLALPKLGNGAYVVTWRVSSADSHPVAGAFTFQIGAAGNATSPDITALAQKLLGSEKGDQTVGVLLGVARWLVFASLALLLGTVAFGSFVWPGARTSRWAHRLTWAGWTGLAVATIAGILLYGPYVAGLGLGDIFSSTGIWPVPD